VRDLKNIDRLFQENLKDFEVSPPNRVWNAIEKQLPATSKKRKIPIWVKISSIAALLTLLFSVGTIYFLPTSNFTKNILPKNSKQHQKIDARNNIKTTTSVDKKSSRENTSEEINEGGIITYLSDLDDEIYNNVQENETNNNNNNNNDSKNNYYLTDTKNLPYLTSSKKVSKKGVTESKFTVATIFAPIYINSFGDGSGVDSQFRSNPTSGNSSYSYGVKIAYKLNNKFSVQSGVNLISLGYTTDGVYVTPGVSVIEFSNLSSNPILSKNETISSKESENSGSLNQVFGYVEIPVEVKYNVVNGKLGINLVGGFSTLLLNKDEVFVETNSFSQSLGSSNNLRSINFSGNIGLDVDYSIRKNLYINISPMFKVQTNTFSKNSGSIQPYYLGVYTGLNYKF